MSDKARAYIYCGDWVAECPREGCSNVEHLFGLRSPGHPPGPNNPRTERKTLLHCSYCFLMADIDWPAQEFMEQAQEILAKRPLPHNRNWYPSNHDIALRFGLEHGQDLAELREENDAHGVPA